jgi:heme exporter protein D
MFCIIYTNVKCKRKACLIFRWVNFLSLARNVTFLHESIGKSTSVYTRKGTLRERERERGREKRIDIAGTNPYPGSGMQTGEL